MKKPYEVIITHSYLLEALNEQEAMKRSMDRFMGRIYKDVSFDGMVVGCEITQRCVPFTEKLDVTLTRSTKRKVVNHDTQSNRIRNRTDSKEQDYIYFSAADEL